MKNRKKIKKKQIEKKNRYIRDTLDARFGQKRRIEKKNGAEIYNIHIYGRYGNERQYFWSYEELEGITKGIILGKFLDLRFGKNEKKETN